FFVPPEAYEPFRARREANLQLYRSWQDRVRSLSGEHKARYDSLVEAKVPADLFEQLVAACVSKDDATRSHSGRLIQKAAELVPRLVGGSADLAGSVKTTLRGGGDVGPGSFTGRNLHFGIREHGM